MEKLTNKIKKVGIGTGLLTLLLVPSQAQERTLRMKIGIAHNTTQMKEISKGCLGIEASLEKGLLAKRFFGEFELGFYTGGMDYSKSQANLGFNYKLLLKDTWSLGIKTAVGVSNENHTKTIPYEIVENSKINSVNTIIGLYTEKIFKNKAGINFRISRDTNNTLNVGIKWVFKPYKPYKNRPYKGL